MNKLVLALFLYFIFIACDKNRSDVDKLLKEYEKQEKIDSLLNKHEKDNFVKSYSDSTGMEKSPIVIVASKITQEKYSNYKDIYLKWKNVSNKTIDGIKFEWYGVDVFGEPADMGNYVVEGYGRGFIDEKTKSNQIKDATFNILSTNAKKVKMARAYEVVFEDGSTWKLEDYKKNDE